MSGGLLGLLALAVMVGTGALWVKRLRQVRAGEVRGVAIAGMAGAALLAVLALGAGPGLLGSVAAGVALAVSGTFLALQPLSRQARKAPAVSVGGPILDFTAKDDSGEPFALGTLRGRPFLLKFFRGHW